MHGPVLVAVIECGEDTELIADLDKETSDATVRHALMAWHRFRGERLGWGGVPQETGSLMASQFVAMPM